MNGKTILFLLLLGGVASVKAGEVVYAPGSTVKIAQLVESDETFSLFLSSILQLTACVIGTGTMLLIRWRKMASLLQLSRGALPFSG